MELLLELLLRLADKKNTGVKVFLLLVSLLRVSSFLVIVNFGYVQLFGNYRIVTDVNEFLKVLPDYWITWLIAFALIGTILWALETICTKMLIPIFKWHSNYHLKNLRKHLESIKGRTIDEKINAFIDYPFVLDQEAHQQVSLRYESLERQNHVMILTTFQCLVVILLYKLSVLLVIPLCIGLIILAFHRLYLDAISSGILVEIDNASHP